MAKPIFYFISIIVLSQTITSCNSDCHDKGNCDPEYFRYDLGEAKNYLWADTGSYWIYKNSKTGELDTQTCVGVKTYWVNTKGSTNYSKHITVDYEVLYRRLYSTYNQWEYVDKTSFYNADAMRPYKTNLYRDVYGEGQNNPFWFPANKNDNGGSGGSITTCTNTDTSIIVNGKTYDHVIVFEMNMDDIWYPNNHPISTRYPNAFYYWIKDIGLIKRYNKSENYSWDLIDYKINT